MLLLNPGLADRPCKICRAYVHRDGIRGDFGPIVLLRPDNRPAPRPKGTRPPCAVCPKIPAGYDPHPDNGVEVTPRTVATYLFHLECRAVGAFPADPIVRRNAPHVDAAIRAADRVREQAAGPAAVAALLGVLNRG